MASKHGQCPSRVKGGKARSEHIPSGLPPKADIVDAFWDFRFVPKSEVTYSIVSSARASEPLINTVWPSGPHRGIAQIWLGENVAPGSGLAVAASAALAGAVVALDPQAVSLGGDPIRPRRELVERRRTCDCVRRH